VPLARIARTAKCLQVADVVGATFSKGNDVIYRKFGAGAAAFTLVLIAF
jgi:hypothetical protein